MLRTCAIACAIAALAGGVPGIAAAAPTTRSATGECAGAGTVAVYATRQQVVDSVLCLVNGERTARGLDAVRASNPLASAAVRHSADMVSGKFFAHASSNGDNLRRRVARTGYSRSRHMVLGETLAWGSGSFATPSQIVSSFMESAAHRRTMLDRRYRDVGVGLALGAPMPDIDGAAATITLNFGRK